MPAAERLLVLQRVGPESALTTAPPGRACVMVTPEALSVAARDRLRALGAPAMRVRVSAQATRRLVIVDRSAAVIDLGSAAANGEPDGVRIDNAELVGMLVAHFERLWRRAAPLTEGPAGSLEMFTSRQRLILELQAEGRSEETISREIGLSKRAVRGEVAAIWELLGATSRFQAGVRYAELLTRTGH